MDPFIGGSLISGGLGAASSLWGARQANKKSLEEAQRNREFQERMSSTAYQRKVQDLKKAGLNPMLAVGGPGASTPSGGQAQLKNIAEGMQQALTSTSKDVLQARMQNKQFEDIDQTIANKKAEENLTKEKEKLTKLQKEVLTGEKAGSKIKGNIIEKTWNWIEKQMQQANPVLKEQINKYKNIKRLH